MSEESESATAAVSSSSTLKRPLLPATPNASNTSHPPKRFRPSPALNKPFRSPLISKPKASPGTQTVQSSQDARSESATSKAPPPATPSRPPPSLPTPQHSNKPIRSINTPYQPSTSYLKHPSTPTPSAPLFSKSASASAPKRTPSSDSTDNSSKLDLNALQRKHASLSQLLRTERAKLDTLQQAIRIEASDEETRLDALIEKWKLAGRQAAELMFGIAKDRVGRNGGIFENKRDNGGFDQGYGWDEGGDGVDEEKRRRMLEEGGYLDENEALGGEDQEDEEEKEEEPEEFTMGKMLKIMGIGKEMLGWDSERNTWD
ncbi:hypothetical protein BJ508DRAFT_415287 [Ascobolus immersus RN42]|uniref:Swi5-domain-containing protein n=1 Tax=Ascobolus immersus RN42 TaxID=1160509 RepID=A0A3N4I8W1_ASCIM|nr:hypothetical protein BJ508DRAFT_415287 [Ascobolus immersus RN42]